MNLKMSVEHSVCWWSIKVAGGFALIAGVFARFLFDFNPRLYGVENAPVALAQALVVIGGLTYLWHYWLVKRDNPDIGAPTQLTRSGGLFAVVRHPMYLADLLTYTGLSLLCATPLTLGILLLSILALFKQARVEDRAMVKRFTIAYQGWQKDTKLILPFVY